MLVLYEAVSGVPFGALEIEYDADHPKYFANVGRPVQLPLTSQPAFGVPPNCHVTILVPMLVATELLPEASRLDTVGVFARSLPEYANCNPFIMLSISESVPGRLEPEYATLLGSNELGFLNGFPFMRIVPERAFMDTADHASAQLFVIMLGTAITYTTPHVVVLAASPP